MLNDQDEVGVLVYDMQGTDKWLFKLTPASRFQWMAKQINGAQIGDMPAFGPTMNLALAGLKASDASAKHMIIISDGDPQPPAPGVLQQYAAAGITISTIAVFPHGNTVQLLRTIAQTTGGRFYFPQNPNTLPQIFIKEARTLRRSMLQNVTFTPESGYPSPVLKGINAIPKLHGYVLTTPRTARRSGCTYPRPKTRTRCWSPGVTGWVPRPRSPPTSQPIGARTGAVAGIQRVREEPHR